MNGNQAWISQLLKHGDFTDALYKLKTGAFADAVASMKDKVETYGKNVASSLAMDQLMWNRTTSAQQQYDTQKANFLERANTTWDAVWNDAALKGVSIAVNEGTGEIVATANTTGDATYQWYKLNEDKTTATACTGATNAAFTPSDAGTYFVAVTGTTMNGEDVPRTMISAAVKSEGHNYSNTWSSDANNHWHACTVEEHTDKKGLAPHNGGTATCMEQATCSTCDQKYGELAKHALTKTEAVDATCTATGNSAYWTCDVCDKFFSDENGETEITENSWVIPATGHDWSNKDGVCKVCKTPCSEAHTAGTTCKVCGKYTPIPVVPAGEPAKNPFNPDTGKARFADVPGNVWYASAVNYVVDKGLMNGTGRGQVLPERGYDAWHDRDRSGASRRQEHRWHTVVRRWSALGDGVRNLRRHEYDRRDHARTARRNAVPLCGQERPRSGYAL